MARAFFRRRKSCPFSGKEAPKLDALMEIKRLKSAKATVKVDPALLQKVRETLTKADIAYTGAVFDQSGIRTLYESQDFPLERRPRAPEPVPAGNDTYPADQVRTALATNDSADAGCCGGGGCC